MNPISLALKILADQERSAFKEKNFELKRKKYIFWLSATSPVSNSSTPVVTEKETFHKLKSRREADPGIALWQIL